MASASLEQHFRGTRERMERGTYTARRLTAVVLDGEVGALALQAEAEGGRLVVFIGGPQGSYHLGRDQKIIKLN